jgi:hypothetical protein
MRIALALMLGIALAGGMAVSQTSTPSAAADDDDDDRGESDDDDDNDDDDGNSSSGPGQSGKDNNGPKEKKEKKDKPGKGNDDDEDDDVTVVLVPDVTPPAEAPKATATPKLDATGALRIVVRDCVGHPADDADWEQVCTTALTQASFELEARDGAFAGWHRDLKVGADGTIELGQLPVGRYALEQDDDDWCRAESDRVDSKGELVIDGGETTTVWIFHCEDDDDGLAAK